MTDPLESPAATHGHGRARALTPFDRQRLQRARGILAFPTGQSAARLRRSASTIIELLPLTPDNVDERKDASRVLFANQITPKKDPAMCPVQLTIFDRVADIAGEQLGHDANDIWRTTPWADLEADSLDKVALTMAFEDAFGIPDLDETVVNLESGTVGDTATAIEAVLAAAKA